MFDPDAFKNQAVEGEMDTSLTPVPAGEWPAVIKETKIRQQQKEDKVYTMMDVVYSIDSDEVVKETGRDENTVRQTIFLDITDSGGLDMSKGKNVGLGRLREAVGQNGPGSWHFGMLDGNVVLVKIEHREYNGDLFADVKKVMAA